MRFYTELHQYYCGIDLHARNMYVCILDADGEKVVHRHIPCDRDRFLQLVEPYREDLVVGVECLFCWYWVADLCADEDIPFVLGHAYYIKCVHGAKCKNDRIDSYKLAALLRGGNFPIAYVYPRHMRATRDLLRRRLFFTRKRAELLGHNASSESAFKNRNLDRRDGSSAPPPSPLLTDRWQRPGLRHRVARLSRTAQNRFWTRRFSDRRTAAKRRLSPYTCLVQATAYTWRKTKQSRVPLSDPAF